MSASTLIAGPTGLIGSAVTSALLADPGSGRVIAVSRRTIRNAGSRLEQWTNADPIKALREEHVEAVICCLGTTMRRARNREAFVHVDKDMVVELARWAHARGTGEFCVVSAIGADPRSRIFYNRVKGEMEEAVKKIGVPSLHISQPGILTGPRREFRLMERIGIAVMKLTSPLMVGKQAKYRPMPHDVLAKAMINATRDPEPGVHIHTYREIVAIAQNSTG